MRRVDGDPVPLRVLTEMELYPVGPWKVRDRMLDEMDWQLKPSFGRSARRRRGNEETQQERIAPKPEVPAEPKGLATGQYTQLTFGSPELGYSQQATDARHGPTVASWSNAAGPGRARRSTGSARRLRGGGDGFGR